MGKPFAEKEVPFAILLTVWRQLGRPVMTMFLDNV